MSTEEPGARTVASVLENAAKPGKFVTMDDVTRGDQVPKLVVALVASGELARIVDAVRAGAAGAFEDLESMSEEEQGKVGDMLMGMAYNTLVDTAIQLANITIKKLVEARD